MKRFIFIVLITNLSLLTGCEVTFEPNVRVQVIGNLVSDNGEPISEAKIGVYTRRTGGFITAPGSTGSDEFLLGRNYSVQDGSFEVNSLYDRDSDFSIIISNDNNHANYIYSTSTVNYDPEDLTFDLQTVTLPRLAIINYNFMRTSGEGNTFEFGFNFKDNTCYEYFIAGVLDASLSRCYEDRFLNRTLNDNSPDVDWSFTALYDTEVEFTYSINGQDPITENFTINQDNYELTLNY
jgi:hypothetical protein